MRRKRRAFWIAFWASALPLILFAWIARAVLGPGGDVFADYAVLTLGVLVFAAPGGTLLGLLLLATNKILLRRNPLIHVGLGIIAGAWVGTLGGAVSCFAALNTV